jgi:hypothetical protein
MGMNMGYGQQQYGGQYGQYGGQYGAPQYNQHVQYNQQYNQQHVNQGYYNNMSQPMNPNTFQKNTPFDLS